MLQNYFGVCGTISGKGFFDNDDDFLLRAMTCFNHLYLPRYSDEQTMHEAALVNH